MFSFTFLILFTTIDNRYRGMDLFPQKYRTLEQLVDTEDLTLLSAFSSLSTKLKEMTQSQSSHVVG